MVNDSFVSDVALSATYKHHQQQNTYKFGFGYAIVFCDATPNTFNRYFFLLSILFHTLVVCAQMIPINSFVELCRLTFVVFSKFIGLMGFSKHPLYKNVRI